MYADGDWLDTAAIVSMLDLVITPDTAIAHLAAAIGHPIWMDLSGPAPDWRWLLEGKETPWYSTMRLFRQDRPGDRPCVFGRLPEALGENLGGAIRHDEAAPADR